MLCPHCPDTTLVISDRSGIEIDYCPQCRGVWLDRGELDKLIERSMPAAQTAPDDRPVSRGSSDERYDSDRKHSKFDKHDPRQRSRKSWLSDIFD